MSDTPQLTAASIQNVMQGRAFNSSVFTVAQLPAGVKGATAFVSDATAPAWGVAIVGGGAVGCPVFHDGTGWKAG